MAKERKNQAPRARKGDEAESAPQPRRERTIFYDDGTRHVPGLGHIDEDGYLIGSDAFEDRQRSYRPTINVTS